MGPLTALEDSGALGSVAGDHRTEREPGHLLLRPSVDGLGGLVPALDLAVGIDTDDGVGDVGDQAGPIAVGGLGRLALGHVAGDDLVGRLTGPGGADAGELHQFDVAVLGRTNRTSPCSKNWPGSVSWASRSAMSPTSVGQHEIGHQGAVVLGEGLGVLLVSFSTDQAAHGPVAEDEAPVLMNEDHIGRDLGQQAVAVDQLAELPLESSLAGNVDGHARHRTKGATEDGIVSGTIVRRGNRVVGDGHGGSPHHHVVDDPVGTPDVDMQVELGKAHAMTDGSQNGSQELFTGVGAGDEVGVRTRILGGQRIPARIALSVVPEHGEAPDSLLESEESFDRRRPHDHVGGLVVDPGHRLELGAGQFDPLGQLEGAVAQGLSSSSMRSKETFERRRRSCSPWP